MLNAFVMARNGFIVSVSGATEIVMECLHGSPLPEELRQQGYDIVPADPPEGERIIAGQIVERLTLTSCGIFEPMTEGSTKPIAETRTHAGIARVARFRFTLS